MSKKRHFLLFGLLCLGFCLGAQQPVGNASLETRLVSINTHYQELAYEQALLEVDDMRWYIKRERQAATPEVVAMATLVYKAVNDPKSGVLFLDEALLSQQFLATTDQKIALIKEISASFAALNFPDKAYAAQKNVLSLQENKIDAVKKEVEENLKSQLDSLRTVYSIAAPSGANQVSIAKEKLYLMCGLIGLLLFSLLAYVVFAIKNYKKQLEQKEYEYELAVGHEKQEIAPFMTAPSMGERTASDTTISSVGLAEKPHLSVPEENPYADELEQSKIALIIEPDAHASLYIRMMLNNRFQVETARTPAEAQEMTNTLFPDLIVCDTNLNGITGTDFIRQTKLSERTSHIPVILLGKNNEEAAMDAARAGAEKWLQRPTPSADLHDLVDEVFAQQKQDYAEFQRLLQFWYSPKRMDSRNTFVQQVLTMIEKNIPDPNFTPEELALKLQYTNALFHKKLLAITGKTPTQLVREMRLEKARYLLETGSVPIPIIAQMVGYEHPGTFALAFKNYFGDNSLLLSQ